MRRATWHVGDPRSADARRRLLAELDIEYEALDVRIKSSLDRVWAVFGKVDFPVMGAGSIFVFDSSPINGDPRLM